jgi:hypothetical protein
MNRVVLPATPALTEKARKCGPFQGQGDEVAPIRMQLSVAGKEPAAG